jgi:EAL domain-containing protein (putative c-di-GMP-specific phosphodiesterase class I)
MLPIDFIKIDGSFTRDLLNEPFQQALLRAIKEISNALGVHTIAEFVETKDELNYLRDIGIDCAQGYYLEKPRLKPYSPDEISANKPKFAS